MVAPASTFTLLGMALEEKPKLGKGAVASYKKAPLWAMGQSHGHHLKQPLDRNRTTPDPLPDIKKGFGNSCVATAREMICFSQYHRYHHFGNSVENASLVESLHWHIQEEVGYVLWQLSVILTTLDLCCLFSIFSMEQ